MSSPFDLPPIPKKRKPTYEELEGELADVRLQRASYRSRMEMFQVHNSVLNAEVGVQKALVQASKVSSYNTLESLDSIVTCAGRIPRWSASLIKIILQLKTIPARNRTCKSWLSELSHLRMPGSLPRQFKAIMDTPALFYPSCETEEQKTSRKESLWKFLLESVTYHAANVLNAEQNLLSKEMTIMQEAEELIGFQRAQQLKQKCELYATKRSHDANAPEKFDYV